MANAAATTLKSSQPNLNTSSTIPTPGAPGQSSWAEGPLHESLGQATTGSAAPGSSSSAVRPEGPKDTQSAETQEDPFLVATLRKIEQHRALLQQEQRLEEALEMADAKSLLDSRSPLDQLPPSRQRLLYQTLCDYSAKIVEDIVTIPQPEGWGLDTTESSLKRFKRRYERRLHSQRLKESQELATEILSDPAAPTTQLDQATERLFKTRLLESVNDPALPARDLRDYFQAYTRLRALELAERKLETKLE